ncbi:MAG: hypothetical protein PHY93_06945 [Bacteriovorax sp.]|nr:hypothetical protein [Bacteriovorax sp.]
MQLHKYLLFIVMLLTINLSGCAYFQKYKTPTNEDVHLDSSLIQNYTQTLEYQEKLRAPFIASYNYGDKNLVYVAALHTDGAGNATHQTITKAFQEFKPEFLIVEGSAFTIVSDPDDIKYANNCQKMNFKSCTEDAFAIIEALKVKIPFCYGEPSDAAIHSTLKKRFITDDELIAFYALRNIPQWKRAGIKPSPELTATWNKKLVEVLVRSSRKFRAKTAMSEAKFKKIYKAKMGRDFNFYDISDDTISPQIDRSPKWANKMAHLVDVLREQFLAKQIETRLNKHKRVLVVYGSAHLIKHRPMLSKVFGESTDTSIQQ